MSRRIESVHDLAQLPQEELQACLRAMRKAIAEAKLRHTEDRREGRLPANTRFSFPAFDWCTRTQQFDAPIRLDPSTPIEEISIRNAARAALRNLGIYLIEDLSAITEQELLDEASIGRHTVERLRIALHRAGMDFLPKKS